MKGSNRPDDHREARRWLAAWAAAGRVLEAERLSRLRQMTDLEAREHLQALLALWRAPALDDRGAELVAHQRWFAAARSR
jgi:hypothetical protein